MAHLHQDRISALLVDDDHELAGMVLELLLREGVTAEHAPTGAAGLAALRRGAPDVLLLDVMLPDANGLDLCRRLRADGCELPILMLTARGDPMDRVLGLEMGADDYLAKPFEKRELVARVRALLRRRQPVAPATPDLHCGALTVHPLRREVSVQGQPVPLSSIEFKLLVELIRTPGDPVSREQLSAAVQSGGYRPLDRTVDVQVGRLRKRLAAVLPGLDWIETVRNEGYALVARSVAPDLAPAFPRQAPGTQEPPGRSQGEYRSPQGRSLPDEPPAPD